MTLETNSTLRPNNDGAQLYLSVKFVQDSAFPLILGEEVTIFNIGDYLLVAPIGTACPDSIDIPSEVNRSD